MSSRYCGPPRSCQAGHFPVWEQPTAFHKAFFPASSGGSRRGKLAPRIRNLSGWHCLYWDVETPSGMKELIDDTLREGELEKAISIFLKWEVLDTRSRNDILLQAARLNDHKRQYSMGLSTQETYSVERSRITYFLLELSSEMERRYLGTPHQFLPRAVLIAGTGTDAITEQEIVVARAIGHYLAERGYILIAGGWQGVDYHATTAFCDTLARKPQHNLHKHLFQILPRHKSPPYPAGNVFYVDEGADEWVKCLNLADYVILIGGLGGTYQTFRLAMRERIPVFPCFATQRDTSRVFADLQADWPAAVYRGIAADDFLETLSSPLWQEADVQQWLQQMERMIERIEQAAASPRG